MVGSACRSDFLVRLAMELDSRDEPIVYTVGDLEIVHELKYLGGRGITLKVTHLAEVKEISGVLDLGCDVDFILSCDVDEAVLLCNIVRSYRRLIHVVLIINEIKPEEVELILSSGPLVLIRRKEMLTQLQEYFKTIQSSRV